MRKLAEIEDINEYLKVLNEIKDDVLILIAVKDNAGQYLDDKIQEELHALGLKENLVHKGMVGYIAAIYEGSVIHEALSEKDGTEEYSGVINGKLIHLVSKPYLSGNCSNIEINGMNYGVNSRGINVVVFSTIRNDVIDRVSFDTHVQEYDCIHLKKHFDVALSIYL